MGLSEKARKAEEQFLVLKPFPVLPNKKTRLNHFSRAGE